MDPALEEVNWCTLLEAGSKALEMGRYDDAETFFQRSLVEAEQELDGGTTVTGNKSPDLARILSQLGDVYSVQGWYPGAEKYYLRALALQEEIPSHPALPRTLTKLALVHRAQGKYQEVEPYFQRALAIYAKSPQEHQLEIIATHENIAHFYRAHGKFMHAEPHVKEALK